MHSQEASTAGGASLVFVIALDGEFDLTDCKRLQEAFKIPTVAGRVIVDLRRTSYIDSSILKCLVELRQRTLERHAQLVLVNLQAGVRRLFDVCEFDKLFDISQGSVGSVLTGSAPHDVRMLTIESRHAIR